MQLRFSNGPEYHRLKKVLMYRPGEEVKRVDESNYREMLYRKPIDYQLLLKQFDTLVDIFRGEGVEVILLNELFDEVGWRPSYIPPNLMFMRDVMGVLKDLVILGNMTYEARRMEPFILGEVLKRLRYGRVHPLGGKKFFEGGDMMFLNGDYLLVGYGPRTSFPAAWEISGLALEMGFNTLLVAMPPFRVHLDGGMMPLDKDLIVAHLPTLNFYPSMVVYSDGSKDIVNAYEFLKELGYTFIPVDDDESKTFGPNVVVLDRMKAISYSWNSKTLKRLKEYGVDIIEFDGTEFRDSGGGPHCTFNTVERG